MAKRHFVQSEAGVCQCFWEFQIIVKDLVAYMYVIMLGWGVSTFSDGKPSKEDQWYLGKGAISR